MRTLRSPNGRMLAVRPLADIDPARADMLKVEVREWLESNERRADRLIVDLSDVRDISPDGLRAIHWAAATMQARGGKLLLTNAAPPVVALLEATGLDEKATVYPAGAPGDLTVIDLE